jgi:hypothetical protein
VGGDARCRAASRGGHGVDMAVCGFGFGSWGAARPPLSATGFGRGVSGCAEDGAELTFVGHADVRFGRPEDTFRGL